MLAMAPSNDGTDSLLVVEDDHAVRLAVIETLRRDGYRVTGVATVAEAVATLGEDRLSLAIVDLGLPDGDGTKVVVTAHEQGVPVIVLTAATEESERVRQLEGGADDFVSKPFSVAELRARVGAVLRRSRTRPGSEHDVLRMGDLVVDRAGRTCTWADQPVELTRTEFDLLTELLVHQGQVLSKAQLLDRVWDHPDQDPNVVEAHLSALRRKLEAHGPRLITTVRGVGYRIG